MVFVIGAIASLVAAALILLIPGDAKKNLPGQQPVDLPENKDRPDESVAEEILDGELRADGTPVPGRHRAPAGRS